MKFEDCLIN